MKATIVRPPPVVQPQPTVTVEMTQDEAEILMAVVGQVGGSGKNREPTDALYYAFRAQGIQSRVGAFSGLLTARG